MVAADARHNQALILSAEARRCASSNALSSTAALPPESLEKSSHAGSGVLVVIPCGKRKVWDARPDQGPTPAGEAYGGPPFVVNRQYAEDFGERWVILSAKYGFVRPDTLIENYDCTFKNPSPQLVDDITLAAQVRDLELCRFRDVVVLGGTAYQERARLAFQQCTEA